MSRRNALKLGALGIGATILSTNAVANTVLLAKDVKFDEEYDVIVIGTGFAGLSAAVKAAERGLSVLVVEKMGRIGGNSTINGGAMAVPNNRLQKEAGIKDSNELFIEDCLKAGLGINHVELLEVIANRASEVVEFLEKNGVEFQGGEPAWFGGHSVARTFTTTNNSGSGIIKPLTQVVEGNSNCKIYKRTKFDEFVLDDSGKVVGIKARTEYKFDGNLYDDDKENTSGEVKYFGAKKGVVLAAGGFAMDKFYRKMQDPRIADDMDATNHAGATAGALMQAFKIGATPVQIDWIQFGPWASPDEKGFGVSPLLTQQGLFKYGIAVDVRNGKRFMNELADRKTRADAEFKILRVDPKANPVAIANKVSHEVQNVVQKGLESGVMKQYNTLDEVAAAYKIPVDALKESVKKYNEGVKAGKDEFGKPVDQLKDETINEAGPFYCIRLTPKPHHTMGGVKINTKAQVISMETKEPIPGLFAAGEITGGTHGASRLGSVAITDCVVFGMIAGENIGL